MVTGPEPPAPPAGPNDPDGEPGSVWNRRRPPTGPAPLPAVRPTWMVLLVSVMAMVAFQQFLGALSELAGRGQGPAATVPGDAAPATAEQAAERALSLAYRQALQELPPAVSRLLGTIRLGYAALLLFAVAAIATRDRRGRLAALASAWAGIVHHVAGALVFLLLIRPAMLRRGSEWMEEVRALTAAAGQPAVSSDVMGGWAQNFLVAAPIGLLGMGLAFSALILVFFGGRRGRAYYGVTARSAVGPARTGA